MGDDLGSKAGLKPFECHNDPATIGSQWTRWMTAFTFYADDKGLIIEDLLDENEDNAAQNRQ